MEINDEGFAYPVVDNAECIDCHLCERVCPVLHQAEERVPISVLAAKNRNESIRFASSSGGIFSLLAEKIIERGGVVFGARFDENWDVIHDYTEAIDGLAAFRGSKYVQSRIGECYGKAKEFLDEGRQVMFTGTSCQVAGLKHYLNREYDNLLAVDVVCHGVPSPLVWQAYLKGLAGQRKITSTNFRDKMPYGWKHYCFPSGSPEEQPKERKMHPRYPRRLKRTHLCRHIWPMLRCVHRATIAMPRPDVPDLISQ